MTKNQAVMIVPNTKNGLAAIKDLAKQIVDNKILIRLITKEEFDLGIGKYPSLNRAKENRKALIKEI